MEAYLENYQARMEERIHHDWLPLPCDTFQQELVPSWQQQSSVPALLADSFFSTCCDR
jgi:hypothetical protein